MKDLPSQPTVLPILCPFFFPLFFLLAYNPPTIPVMSSSSPVAAVTDGPDGRQTLNDSPTADDAEADGIGRRRTKSDATGSSSSWRTRRLGTRQRSIRERLWPACLGGAKAARRRSMRNSAADDSDDDGEAELRQQRIEENKLNEEEVNGDETFEILTADRKQKTVTSSSSMDADGSTTVVLTGGGPYGFRLSDDSSGQLIVSKVNITYAPQCFCILVRNAMTNGSRCVKLSTQRVSGVLLTFPIAVPFTSNFLAEGFAQCRNRNSL